VQGCVQRRNVLHDDPSHPEVEELGQGQWRLELDYRPFQAQSGARLISPKTPPSLQIDHDYPVLDGAEALIPIYAAAANAIYKADVIRDGENTRGKTVRFSQSSPAAYKALLDGEADMIFAAAPSDEQKQEAAAKGLSYTLTPIGREAFVFLVNEQNPVKSLSVEQLRDIYSGKINDWKDVGGAPEKIMAFQRNEGSGSQTAMLRGVMRGTPMRKPLEAEYVGGMGGLLRGVAGYRNFGNAIGYSFRYYATAMNSVPGIRLLAVNGIEPTVENIRNGSYPFTNDFYIVTVRPPSENAARLRDWFVSDEGQQFIAEAGYVPLRGGSR
jgi:phosphate transport system substrate-binding protein